MFDMLKEPDYRNEESLFHFEQMILELIGLFRSENQVQKYSSGIMLS
jgi:hypothetical protein